MRKKPGFKCVLRRLYIPIYGQYLNILVAEKPWEAWPVVWPEVGHAPPPLGQGKTCFDNEEGEGYIAIRCSASQGTVAHESAHLTNYLLRYVGAKLDTYNDEPFCYLLGWIVDQIEEARKEKPILHRTCQ